MHPDYDDITSRLGQPLWYYNESVAIPRYDPFRPDLCGIYDDWAALTSIRCQGCHKQFLASVGYDVMKKFKYTTNGKEEFILPTEKSAEFFDAWGDPPRHDGCVGETMSSELISIKEFWIKDCDVKSPTFMEWVRHPEYEFDYSKYVINGWE